MINQLEAAKNLNNIRNGYEIKKDGFPKVKEADFKNVLKNELEKTGCLDELKFSKHASERLSLREINITEDNMKNINEAVDKANKKGLRESLVIFNDVALIVNVKNRVVLTAMKSDNLKESIVTNIDSAIIIN